MVIQVAKSTIAKWIEMEVCSVPRIGERICFDEWDEDSDFITDHEAIVEDVIYYNKPLNKTYNKVYAVLVLIKFVE